MIGPARLRRYFLLDSVRALAQDPLRDRSNAVASSGKNLGSERQLTRSLVHCAPCPPRDLCEAPAEWLHRFAGGDLSTFVAESTGSQNVHTPRGNELVKSSRSSSPRIYSH